MDKENAIRLIEKTFNFPFDEENYTNFSKNLIDDIRLNINPSWDDNKNLPTDIKEKIIKYKKIGLYEYDNGERLAILCVKLKSENTVNRSRYLQRNFSKWFMDKHNLDAILISFFAEKYVDWRFSLIKLDYKREITDKGNIKVSKNLTPLRRYSYLVGENEPNHTAKSQLSPLLLDESKNPGIDDLIEAFSVENVSKSFYKDYTSIFFKFEKFILKKFNISNSEARSFTQNLFNRLMFTRFIEKKSWLKFNNSNKYLFELFKAGDFKNEGFYKGRLLKLFFEGFSNEEINKNEAYGEVNFFGGELFDKTELDTKVKDIPNYLFSEILGSDGLFYKYNFTVEESTPLETEVSIDPEMLGKVFEELVTGRTESGAFYTPKSIVEFMCKKSLSSFLNSIELIQGKEKFNKEEKELLLIKVQRLKVLDPACGSGAYLIGMLNEILKVFQNLENKNEDQIDKYKLKLNIIQNSIYGVDIDSVAIQIAKLRLWLTLVVEYDGDKPQPLPNLNFKIEQGNSISSNLIENNEPDLFIEEIIFKFNGLKAEYQLAKRKNKKERLIKEISYLKKEIKNSLFGQKFSENLFEWKLEFAEIFIGGNKSGFDIIISNPPYIKENKHSDAFKSIKDSKYYKGKMDIWYMFFCQSIDLLSSNGILAFIAENNWYSNFGASKMRKKIIEDCQIIEIKDFGNSKVFENASIQTMILTCKKISKRKGYSFSYSKYLNKNIDQAQLNNFLKISLPNDDPGHESMLIDFAPNKISDKSFSFYSREVSLIITKILQNKNFFIREDEITNGIHPHHAKVTKKIQETLEENQIKSIRGEGIFVIDESKKSELLLNKLESKIIKPIFYPKELKKYSSINQTDQFIIYTNNKFNSSSVISKYPSIKSHLDRFKKVITSDFRPYGLHRARKEVFFTGEKIISLRKCPKPKFTFTDFDSYVLAEHYVIKTNRINLKYLTLYLNSKIIRFWLLNKGKMQGNIFQIDKEPLINIPIFDLEDKSFFLKKFDEISKSIFESKDISGYVDEVDNQFFKLFKLSSAEIEYINNKINFVLH